MDVDEGEFLLSLFIFSLTDILEFLDTTRVVIPKERAVKTVRLLPYVEVPHMDTSSHIFRKAEATVAKQVSPSSSSTSSSSKASVERLFDIQQGTWAFYSLLDYF